MNENLPYSENTNLDFPSPRSPDLELTDQLSWVPMLSFPLWAVILCLQPPFSVCRFSLFFYPQDVILIFCLFLAISNSLRRSYLSSICSSPLLPVCIITVNYNLNLKFRSHGIFLFPSIQPHFSMRGIFRFWRAFFFFSSLFCFESSFFPQ